MLISLKLATVSVGLLVLTTSCFSSNPASEISATSKMALASHLKQIDAKFYGAYWCSYCKKQKELFGQEAFRQINYVECDPAGKDARPELCQKAHIEGFPTWEIKGQLYPGMQSLQQLADISGYKDDRELKN